MEVVAGAQLVNLNPLIAQSIALVTHANAFLLGKKEDPTELVGTHSAFRTTFEATFDRLGPKNRPFSLADGTAPWFRRLQKEEVSRMSLVLTPLAFEKCARVAGLPEPRWGLVTEGDVGTELWAPNWTIRIGINAREIAAPWKASWQAEKTDRTILRGDELVHDAMENLAIALRGMAPFVRALGGDEEKVTYEELMEALSDENATPKVQTYPDLFEAPSVELEARRTGTIAALAIGLFIASGWKDRKIAHEQVQDAFDAARNEVWDAGIVAIQSVVNSSAEQSAVSPAADDLGSADLAA